MMIIFHGMWAVRSEIHSLEVSWNRSCDPYQRDERERESVYSLLCVEEDITVGLTEDTRSGVQREGGRTLRGSCQFCHLQ